MLTMSHSINASERGSWKESYRSGDSVETNSSSEESDNSSSGGGSVVSARQQTGNGGTSTGSSSHLQPPIGCITTHSVSAVIRPERKMPPIDPLQFVKIQKNELSKKAVEQIKLAEEVKITKEKIKEVEEEWQNNLMSWKSKRKLTKNNSEDESLMQRNPNRKTKTFSEILHEKARSGARIGYNLHKYVDAELEEEFDIPKVFGSSEEQEECEPVNLPSDSQVEKNLVSSDEMTETNLNRFLNSNTPDNLYDEQISRNGLGEMVVFNTSLLEEFSVKSEVNCDNTPQLVEQENCQSVFETSKKPECYFNQEEMVCNEVPHKVHVPINEWKSPSKETQQQILRQPSTSSDDDAQHHNSSFEGDEEDELDEEFERLRLDQERSFKAKLSTFEALAKQEEEAAKRAAEANIRRRQNRQKLIAERSKSLSNIQQSTTQSKAPLTNSYSVSNSSLPKESIVSEAIHPSVARSHFEKQAKSMSNVNATHQPSVHLFDKPSSTSVVYNFKDNPKTSEEPQTLPVSKPQAVETNQNSSQSAPSGNRSQMNIYENVASLGSSQSLPKQVSQPSPSETISDSDAIRNASQKLLQQQQQIYQNQPLPVQYKQASGGQYPSDHYSNLPAHANYAYPYEMHSKQPHVLEPIPPTDALMNEKVVNPVPIRGGYPIVDNVGLPLQITKTTQAVPEEHLYQNQLMINSSLHGNYIGYSGAEIPSRREELAAYPPEMYHHQPPSQQQVMSQYMSRQQQQYLYYPKPYSGANAGHKPVAKQSVGARGSVGQAQSTSGRGSANSAHQLPYNQNHWLLQEAELRQSNQRLTKSSQMHNGKNPLGSGYLSVSGKKKCSSCGDELGKGCAAMVVESLSLYYHINCFRCSVCNVQLGNGTVGTDVRVRNNKLHCQNCYSNDEAGLKFSRV